MRSAYVNLALVLGVLLCVAKGDGQDELSTGELETTTVRLKPMKDCPMEDILRITGCACYIFQMNGTLSVTMWKLCNSVHKERPEKLESTCANYYSANLSSSAPVLNEDLVFEEVVKMTEDCKPAGEIDTKLVLPTPYPSAFPERGTMPKPWPALAIESTEASTPEATADPRPIEDIMYDEFHDFEMNLGVMTRSGASRSAFGKNYYCCKLHYYSMKNAATCVIKSRCGGVKCR